MGLARRLQPRLQEHLELRIKHAKKLCALCFSPIRPYTFRANMTTKSSLTQISRRMISAKAEQFTESVIREMTRLALKHSAVNLSQGFPDFPAPDSVKEAARQAISDDINQYAITWGAKPLR